ncbi:MAG: c-type cytochrome [Pseudomonadota bacterium]
MKPVRICHAVPALLLFTLLAGCTGSVTRELSAEECPQPRFTDRAPDEYLQRQNPLPATRAHRQAGERLYLDSDASIGCAVCHGKTGNGLGPLASQFNPRPRNFACAATVNGIPDGQLFWIIRFGSPGTAMPAHAKLDDTQVWQLVHHLRQLAR